MSASRPGNMRGPRVKTPLLLLLLLLNVLTGTVLCNDDEDPGAETADETTSDSSNGAGDGGQGASESTTAVPNTPLTPDLSPDSISTGKPVQEDIEEEHGSGQARSIPGADDVAPTSTEEPTDVGATTIPVEEEQNLGLIIIAVLVVLVIVIIGIIVCGIFICRRWNKKPRNQELRKEDPYLDESGTEKVPMPMFEEDVPSVLELEMEELDQWMKKDGETAVDSNPA
ncbi:transmembrane protein 154 isoform X1 [Lates japonicus]|uniref:Transmembrane protein 154 isoform X1 n=1 Tax=Lates japonicus TaxID=270547 RepID=A0AAD3MCQ6_LATJO|nr:transmembrane protein 154 isoform X1 [Lates japonicus]